MVYIDFSDMERKVAYGLGKRNEICICFSK
jgi:hypothetical protein